MNCPPTGMSAEDYLTTVVPIGTRYAPKMLTGPVRGLAGGRLLADGNAPARHLCHRSPATPDRGRCVGNHLDSRNRVPELGG